MFIKDILLHLKLRHKFAALGLLGMLTVAVPLVPVLRYQSAEIEAALAEQAGLDPVTRAVDVQRSLLTHRDVARQVLRGHAEFEPEQRLRQAEVDARVALLMGTLARGRVGRAQEESLALLQDWMALASRVQARSVSVAESDAAHRLLVEQVLQVIDLVADASGLRQEPGTMTDRVATRALPRRVAQVAAQVAAQIAALDAAAKGDDTAIAAAEARLARAIGGLNEALEPGSPMDSALANATAAAGATADLLFRLRRQPAAAASDELRGATAAAIAAQFALVDAAGESVSRTLAARVSVAERQRALLLALLLALILALGTAAAGLAWQVVHRAWALPRRNGLAGAAGHPVPADAAAPTVPTDGQARIEHEAGRLLQRLREPGDTAPENPTSASAAALKAPTQGI